MRVWFDMTAPAHPIVLRPVIERLREQGHDVHVTARDYAQTLGILDRLGIPYQAVGRHGGASRPRKLAALLSRTARMGLIGRRGAFDLAIAHGSNDLPLAAAALGIPEVNTFDYEWATVQHRIGCRLASRVVVPEWIPPERLRPYGVSDGKLRRYPGLKEEYYLADFEPDPAVLAELGLDATAPLAVVRTPPAVSLYHRFEHPLFVRLLERLRRQAQTVVLPRTAAQRAELAAAGGFVVPERTVDAQSLVACADVVVSAGGTMNREAVALGTPVYTTYGGRLGGVDEALIRSGRLRPLTDPRALELTKFRGERRPLRRDPAVLSDMILQTPR